MANHIVLVLFTLSLPLFPTSASSNAPLPSHPFTRIYAFGDSYTDTGNTGSATGPTGFTYVSNPPYGTTFFHHPTNRYSDGRLVIDFVASFLSLPFIPPYLRHDISKYNGVNFAVAGSTAIEHRFFMDHNVTTDITPESLWTQLTWMNKYLEGEGCNQVRCSTVFQDALVWVGEIGANDYAYSLVSTLTPTTIQELAINRVSGFLQALLNKGAKYVVVQGLPPTGCLPLAMTLAAPNDRDDIGCVATANKQSSNHNARLQASIHRLRRQFPKSTILYADYYNAFRAVMKDPAKFGFKNTFNACCGARGPYNFDILAACGSPSSSTCANPSEFVNWDGVHLTEAMNKAVSEGFFHGGFCEPSFEYLINMKQKRGK